MQGYTKRKLAEIFEVGPTTIWKHVYADPNKIRRSIIINKQKVPSFRNQRCIWSVIQYLKNKGYTSNTVSLEIQVPLRDVNYLWVRLRK